MERTEQEKTATQFGKLQSGKQIKQDHAPPTEHLLSQQQGKPRTKLLCITNPPELAAPISAEIEVEGGQGGKTG